MSLAGCQSPDPLPEPSPEPTATAAPSPAPSPTSSPSFPPGDDTAGFYVDVVANSYYDYAVHEESAFTKACQVVSTDVDKDINCIIEAEELDLYFHGITLDYNVPSTLCAYVKIAPPWFYAKEPGNGATSISYNIKDGAVSSVVVTPAGSATVSNNGTIRCKYDYSSSGGSNCCEGSYDLTVNSWNPDTLAYDITTTATGNAWGGLQSNCTAGPGVDTQEIDSLGFPFPSLYYVEGTGIHEQYTVVSALSKRHSTNLYAANYFTGGTPTAFATPANGGYRAGQTYYDFTCYDRANEEKARIRVMVREWNDDAEFLKGTLGNWDSGDNDFADWADTLSYPGAL